MIYPKIAKNKGVVVDLRCRLGSYVIRPLSWGVETPKGG